MPGLKVVGLGGSLREASRSRAALAVALEGAVAAGASVELLDLRELGLPMYRPDLEFDPPAVVRTLIDGCSEVGPWSRDRAFEGLRSHSATPHKRHVCLASTYQGGGQ